MHGVQLEQGRVRVGVGGWGVVVGDWGGGGGVGDVGRIAKLRIAGVVA